MLPNLKTAIFWIALFVGYATMDQGGSVHAAGPETSKAGKKGQAVLTIKAAIVRGDGNIIPVARTTFTILNFNRSKLRAKILAELEQKNNAGPRPDSNDPKYKKTECTPYIGSCHETTDLKLYLSDSADWSAKAYAGKDAMFDSAEAGGVVKTITTNLEGEASLSLSMGTWYISGYYSLMGGRSSVSWNDVEVSLNAPKKTVELSNDNGEVLNIGH